MGGNGKDIKSDVARKIVPFRVVKLDVPREFIKRAEDRYYYSRRERARIKRIIRETEVALFKLLHLQSVLRRFEVRWS